MAQIFDLFAAVVHYEHNDIIASSRKFAMKTMKEASDTKKISTLLNNQRLVGEGLFEIYESLIIIRDAQDCIVKNLSTINAKGVKSRVNELRDVSKALSMIVSRANGTLLKTGKKSGAVYVSGTEKADRKHKERAANTLRRAQGLPIIEGNTGYDKMKHWLLTNKVITIPLKESCPKRSCRMGGIMNKKRVIDVPDDVSSSNHLKFPFVLEIQVEKEKMLEIHIAAKQSFQIPMPAANGLIYTHREIILIIDDLQQKGKVGMQRLIRSLNTLEKLQLCWTKFKAAWDNYVKSGWSIDALPEKTVCQSHLGRKRLILSDTAVKEMNERIHNSSSEVRSPKDDARENLTRHLAKKRRIDASKFHYQLNTRAVANYAALSLAKDPDILVTKLSTARLKSLSRIIASKS